MDNPSGKTDHVWIKSLRSENAALRTKVKELEEFVKHDYMSMKNWHEEKAALQAKVEKLTDAMKQASLNFNWSTKYGKGWHDALAYVKQALLKQ